MSTMTTMSIDMSTAEMDQLINRYGEENCQRIGRSCFVLNLNTELTLFITESEVILNIGGVEKDLSTIYQSNYHNSFVGLCDWIEERYGQDYRNENDEELDQYLSDNTSESSSSSSSSSSLNEMISSSRVITIYTWGNSIRKHKPECSQMNFNAIPIVSLNRKEAGLNLKKLNGTNQEIQQCLFQIPRFNTFITQIVTTIEEDPSIDCISINCKNGIHRSVAVAEILKNEYYPNAQVIHLELGRSSKR